MTDKIGLTFVVDDTYLNGIQVVRTPAKPPATSSPAAISVMIPAVALPSAKSGQGMKEMYGQLPGHQQPSSGSTSPQQQGHSGASGMRQPGKISSVGSYMDKQDVNITQELKMVSFISMKSWFMH